VRQVFYLGLGENQKRFRGLGSLDITTSQSLVLSLGPFHLGARSYLGLLGIQVKNE